MRIRGRVAIGAALLVWAVAIATPARARSGYYLTPDIHGDQVVFSSEGDLWTASISGGEARRITNAGGAEYRPKFSPDGQWIAFAGDYDGNRDVYVIPATGGEPKRLTWHPASDEPIGWSADGKEIYFRSRRDHPHFEWEIYRIPAQGGDPVKVPIGGVVEFSIDPQSGRYAFNRLGGGGTWKRYRGGTASEIWVGDPAKSDYAVVTTFPGENLAPMWHDGRIYFLCDLGGTANIWSMNPDGSDRKQLTDLGKWDARTPSMDAQGRIVFSLAGDLHLFDPASGHESVINIELPSERLRTRIRYPNAGEYLTEYELAPDGDRLAVVTRGEIFSVPVKPGITLPVTRGSGAREKFVSYDPKGKRLLYVTDEGGEEKVVTGDAWGAGDVKQVAPTGTSTWHFPPKWSPDGKWIAYGDQLHNLYLVKAGGGDPVVVDHCTQQPIREYTWSPDGRWLAYTMANTMDRGSIYIYDTKEKTVHRITGEFTDDGSPAWDPQGRYLYFLSDRTINPILDTLDFETILYKPTRPYLVLLRPDVENPFAATKGAPPKEGEKKDKKDVDKTADHKKGGGKKDQGKEDDGKKDGDHKDAGKKDAHKKDKGEKKGKEGEDEDKIEPIEINFDGIADRVVEVPVKAGRYIALSATEDNLFYISATLYGLGEDTPDQDEEDHAVGDLISYKIEDKEAKTFMEGIRSYDLQPKSGKIAVQKEQDEIYVVDADSPPSDDDLGKHKVSLEDLVVERDPQAEWRQIYLEAWRGMRDFYWDPGMHGVDWAAIRDQYATLLPRISSHDELEDLIAEMIGELATSHTYVYGGDRGVEVPQRPTGLLGAVLTREGDAFKVTRIYRADPADRVRSPLSEPGVDVKEGDYILAVDHKPFSPQEPFEASLENLAGKEVLLTVNSRPDKKGAREVVAKTMKGLDEYYLRYGDWVRANREYVAQKTGGKIGYIHIPDMGGWGMREFDTWFYPQLDKEGMVVDSRWNGGGFVSQLMVSRLLRQLIGWDRQRSGGIYTYPDKVLNGPFVVLLNQNAGSDGDVFPAAIQALGAAPIIGMRSWGGVNGFSDGRPLVDAGTVTNPEYAWWHRKLGWGIENHGVDPDILVEDLPQELAHGVDAQLDRGIAEVMRLRAEKPPLQPVFGPSPDRSRKAYAGEK